jgi:hypothetical protein
MERKISATFFPRCSELTGLQQVGDVGHDLLLVGRQFDLVEVRFLQPATDVGTRLPRGRFRRPLGRFFSAITCGQAHDGQQDGPAGDPRRSFLHRPPDHGTESIGFSRSSCGPA